MNKNGSNSKRSRWVITAVALTALLVGSAAAAAGPGGPFGDDHPSDDAPGQERSHEARAGHGGGDAGDDGNETEGNETGGDDGASGDGGDDGEGDGQLTICHVPPGNPDAAHTIRIGAPAWQAHEGHGDSKGACPGDEEPADGSDENETEEPDENETQEPDENETEEPESNATADVGVSGNATSDGDGNATYTFVVGSEGNTSATNVTLDVDFSDADANWTTLSGDAADSCTLGNGTVSCEFGELAPGDTATLVIELNGTACGDIDATAVVAADADDDPSDDEATATASMRPCE